MTDYQVLGSLDQRELELTHGLSILKKVHGEQRDGPDKIALETSIRVLESELDAVRRESEQVLS